jgi:hypothetical protein
LEDAVARAFMANTLLHGQDSIARESVELLLERGLRKVDKDDNGNDLYTWTSDLRLRIPSPVNLVIEQVSLRKKSFALYVVKATGAFIVPQVIVS